MALTIVNDHFYDTGKDKTTGIHAKQSRSGRWQYRIGKDGSLLASGMPPSDFVKSFWYRDDFQESE